ncbi:hypothetical protein ACIQ9Q_24820 [Streptomyces sp. NPDC094438]|uniref:hypothetical protein n=1 Tax=Streptomyces sp. NPDC094438 TaxID=3366061 RepID=UPI0037F11FE5
MADSANAPVASIGDPQGLPEYKIRNGDFTEGVDQVPYWEEHDDKRGAWTKKFGRFPGWETGRLSDDWEKGFPQGDPDGRPTVGLMRSAVGGPPGAAALPSDGDSGQRGYIQQSILVAPDTEYRVTYWAGDTNRSDAIYALVLRQPQDQGYLAIRTQKTDTRDPSTPLGWTQGRLSFRTDSDTKQVTIRFVDNNTTNTMVAGIKVYGIDPTAHTYSIARTQPESTPDNPITAPADSSFDAFRLQLLDETNQPLSSQDVTLQLEPRMTGSSFVSRQQTSLRYPARTDVQGWLTVPAGALHAGVKNGPMQLNALLHGSQLDGQVDLKVGTAAARFSVAPPPVWDLRPTPVGTVGYPGVRVRAEDEGQVPRQSVSVVLPPDRGLQPVPERDNRYQLTVLGADQSTRYYPGTLDGQTLTFENVDLALPGKGSLSTLWIAVKAADNAPLGDTYLNFRVGDRAPVSTPFRVVAR